MTNKKKSLKITFFVEKANGLSLFDLRSAFLAGIAQLVEYKLPKLGVAGSNPVARSMFETFSKRDIMSADASLRARQAS